MSQDSKVLGFVSPADVAALMRETGVLSVETTSTLEGNPVIQAAVKVMNAKTGEELPGGLPFAVVLFRNAGEPGYTNVAIGTSVPVADLGITLPPDFFNQVNQHYRFLRAYLSGRTSVVLQMDLFLRHATQEYVKFAFGLWAAGFSQILLGLFGQQEGEAPSPALEAFAAAPEDALANYAAAVNAEPETIAEAPVEEIATEAEAEVAEEPAAEALPEAPATEVLAEAVEIPAEEIPAEEPAATAVAEEEEALPPAEAVPDRIIDLVAEQDQQPAEEERTA